MFDKSLLKNELLGKCSILSNKKFIEVAQQFVIFYAKNFQFLDDELKHIELIVEEALIAIISNSFSDDLIGYIDISVSYKTGKFILSFHDNGIPIDFETLETSKDSFLSIILIKHLANEFNLINLGNEGKILEIIKYINNENIDEVIKETKIKVTEKKTDIKEIRLLKQNEVLGLSRLAFSVYGYTYTSDFYYPDRIREMMENGLLVSAVSINSRDEVVGNLSLIFKKRDSKVADSGAAMVHPDYRGCNLFERLKLFLSSYAKENNLYGIYSEATTIHPYTQKGNLNIGAKVIGIMLAYINQNVTFKEIYDKKQEVRQTSVQFFLKTNKEPHRKVFVNEKFSEIIKQIYASLEYDREVVTVDDDGDTDSVYEHTHYTISIKPDFNVAEIYIEKLGRDVSSIINYNLHQLCLKKYDVIYLHFPIMEAFAGKLIEQVNNKGFLFSGIIPEFSNGDIIKMQYLNNVLIKPEEITLVDDFSRQLLNLILKDYNL